jgi:trans-aconitate 2-methyltransferase
MPTWDADLYLRFAEERTRPCRDLAARVMIDVPRRVIDLGCGPGNSTQVVADRWPTADVTGLDNSAVMIAAAREAQPMRTWVQGDIDDWARSTDQLPFDIVFSNAALQWVDDHATLFPLLLEHVVPRGALAVQVPSNWNAPAHQAARDLASSSEWRETFPRDSVREWHVEEPTFYCDLLAGRVEKLDLWETEYFQVMPSAEAIVEWYRGTGLRPYLDRLTDNERREKFLAEYLEQIRRRYPSRKDGSVAFPFRRLFVVAYR